MVRNTACNPVLTSPAPPEFTLGVQWAGFKSWFAREGLFKLTVSGTGTVWYGAYGGLLEKEVHGEYIVDTSHLGRLRTSNEVKHPTGWRPLQQLFGGEGFVTRVEGKGKIVVQTRSMSGLADWINPRLW